MSLKIQEPVDTSDILTGKEAYEVITVTVPSQVTFNLATTPINQPAVRMMPEGGIELINGTDFTVASNVVSYIAASPSFSVGERILFKYFKP